jgi:hypothetical protein
VPKPAQAYEPEVPVEMREWIGPALAPPLQHPFIVESKFGEIDEWPAMDAAEYRAMRARNKAALQDSKEEVPPKRLFPDTHGAAPATAVTASGERLFPPAEVTDKKPKQTTDEPIVQQKTRNTPLKPRRESDLHFPRAILISPL